MRITFSYASDLADLRTAHRLIICMDIIVSNHHLFYPAETENSLNTILPLLKPIPQGLL